jgi:hypothetical protein
VKKLFWYCDLCGTWGVAEYQMCPEFAFIESGRQHRHRSPDCATGTQYLHFFRDFSYADIQDKESEKYRKYRKMIRIIFGGEYTPAIPMTA